MTHNTTKIITLAVLIVSAIMSGCINSELTDSQTPINANVAVVVYQDIEPVQENPELTSKSTPIPLPEKRHIQITASQEYDSLIVGIQGGDDYQQLREVQVTVNNKTLDIYTPEYQVLKPIPCAITGEWKVVCRGIFEDGEIQTIMTTRFNGLPDSYTKTPTTSHPVLTPTAAPTAIPTATLAPTPTPTPTKNADPVREVYVAGIGSFEDDMFTIQVTCEVYHDIEAEIIRSAKHPGITFRDIIAKRVHPDLKSYNVYINDELRGSYPPPTMEALGGNGMTAIHPRVTPDDYPMTVTIETEYVDGEIFTNTRDVESGRIHRNSGGRRPVECEWCE